MSRLRWRRWPIVRGKGPGFRGFRVGDIWSYIRVYKHVRSAVQGFTVKNVGFGVFGICALERVQVSAFLHMSISQSTVKSALLVPYRYIKYLEGKAGFMDLMVLGWGVQSLGFSSMIMVEGLRLWA